MAYKDSLFRSIFGNEKSALALYNAVCGARFSPEDTEVVINTLGETLWSPGKNDLSFLVNRGLVVIAEHQSTINENMPYRMLQYVCRLFENGVTDKRAVYKRALVKHARPRFIVLLNSAADFPDRKKLRLSDSFEMVDGYGEAALELEVDVYNVNEGRNRAILEACAELKGYAFFVSRAGLREKNLTAQGGLSRKERTREAIRLAIRDCKDAGLLREFWEKLSQEEMGMLANDWDMKTALEVEREEGYEKGREERDLEIARNALARGTPLRPSATSPGLTRKPSLGFPKGRFSPGARIAPARSGGARSRGFAPDSRAEPAQFSAAGARAAGARARFPRGEPPGAIIAQPVRTGIFMPFPASAQARPCAAACSAGADASQKNSRPEGRPLNAGMRCRQRRRAAMRARAFGA